MNSPSIHHSVPELSAALLECHRSGAPVAFVPTMGYLHDGHATLIRQAAEFARRVVVSIFVNPLQFGPNEDFDRYPRDFDRDLRIAVESGATDIFAPGRRELVPADMVVSVDPGSLANVLCGRSRPGHFNGVCTIVAKLFHVVRPTHAVFGWKDAQQFVILRRMVRDLGFDVQMVGVETVREADGLAMSSRNVYLTPEERAEAPAIRRALVEAGRRATEDRIADTRELMVFVRTAIEKETSARVDYVEAVDLDALAALDRVLPGNTMIAAAAYFGKARLIDNIRF